MKKLRVLQLVREGLEPAETIDGLDDDQIVSVPWKTEFDVKVTLEELGHQVRLLGLYDDLSPIRVAIEQWQPHIAFNMLEEFHGLATFDHHVASYLELLRLPYTGCNPRGMILARDKALSKELLTFHRIRSPRFAVFSLGRNGRGLKGHKSRLRRPRRLNFPLFVKSLSEDASLGISQASIVHDDEGLAERVAFIHEKIESDAIAEQYVEGRELYVGVIGNRRLEVLPVWELLIDHKPDGVPMIATGKVKWDVAYQKKWGVQTRAARDLSHEQLARIAKVCKRIYRVLGLSGYARMDFRLSVEGELYFIEANPNPQLAYGEDFAESAEAKGISYEQLVQRILSLGLRWKAHQPA